jgi:hypothetical protein
VGLLLLLQLLAVDQPAHTSVVGSPDGWHKREVAKCRLILESHIAPSRGSFLVSGVAEY